MAALLSPGNAIFATGDTAPVGGVVIAGGVPVPFSAPTINGTLTSSVIAGDTSNPWGGLTFTYLVTNTSPSSPVGRLTVSDYANFLTNASYQTPEAGIAPGIIDRSPGDGDVIGFNFLAFPIGSGVLTAGTNSALLVVQTNATAYQTTIASVIDGTVATVSSFAPVPEPSTLMLTLVATVSAMLLFRRSRRSIRV